MADNPGLADEEGCRLTGMTGNSYRPARVKLEQLGLLWKTDGTRKTAAGRNASIYMLTMIGKMESSR